MRVFAFILPCWFLFAPVSGQPPKTPILERQVTLSCDQLPIRDVLDQISSQTQVQFSYSNQAFNANQRISIHLQNKPLRYTLNRIFRGKVTYKVKSRYLILQKVPEETLSEKKTKDNVVEGYVFDESGKTLPEASVYNKGLMAAAVTDEFGYFRLELPPAEQIPDLQVSKAGYSNIIIPSATDSSQTPDVEASLWKTADSSHQTISSFITDSIWGVTLPKWLIPKKILITARNLGDTIFRKAQFSVAPKVSTNNLLTGNVRNDVSLNLLAGYVQSVDKFEAGALINIVRHDMTGIQLAGVGNIVGRRTKGIQLAGVFNTVAEVEGLQAAGVLNSTRSMSGMQLAGVVNTSGSVAGLQAAGVINYAREFADIQIASNINYAKRVTYLQVSGGTNIAHSAPIQIASTVNVATDTAKYQLAGLLNYAGDQSTIQVAGLLNLSRKAGLMQVAGVLNRTKKTVDYQLASILNVAGHVKKVQIGLINIADSCDGITLGLFSYVKHGYHKLEFYADDIAYTNLSFRTGSKYLHSIFQIGYQSQLDDDGLFVDAFGFGASFGDMRKWLFDVDVTSHSFWTPKKEYDTQLYKLYLGFEKKLGKQVSIAVGASGNFMLPSSKTPLSLESASRYSIKLTDSKQIKSWIGWKVGLRFL